ncbi:MAG: hypothetical protein JNJ54_10715, partial [Myxococcaceae bacterium]|nr:hypothetical protein [Myxococcaceae bacterium]
SGGVCNAGTCNPCSQGSSCTTNPNSACRNGYVECGSGSGVCTDGSNKVNGTPCLGGVCNSGTCNPCNQNAPCNPTACTIGEIECTSGSPVCDPSGNQPPGFACPGGVCNGSGSCVACSPGAACTTNPNPCMTGAISCVSGGPVCQDDVAKPNLSACPGGRCAAGACCTGCISSGTTCRAGTTRGFCGQNGDDCDSCPTDWTCQGGYCEPGCGQFACQ